MSRVNGNCDFVGLEFGQFTMRSGSEIRIFFHWIPASTGPA